MSQEDPLGLAHPPDGALVVVEREFDEGVVLVEVDLVQSGGNSIDFKNHPKMAPRVFLKRSYT